MLNSLMYFELTFVYGVRQESNFIICMWISSFPSTIYWKKLFFSYCIFGTLLKIIWLCVYEFISGFSVLFYWFACIVFMPVSYSFDYYSFKVQFQIRKCGASNIVSFAQDCLGCLGSFMGLYEF